MSIALITVIIYLVAGILVLVLFDLVTKRIRSKILIATAETQSRMAEAGSPVGSRSARILFLLLMWLFWPAVILGAIAGRRVKEDKQLGNDIL